MSPEDIRHRLANAKHATSVASMQCDLIGILAEAQIAAAQIIAESTSQRDIYMNDIRAFMEKFGWSYNGEPRKLDGATQLFRITCLREELKEYEDACADGNMEAQFDALIDLVYFALGTAYLHGFPFRAGWRRVQEANMSKVLALKPSESKRGFVNDIIKPKGWKAPVLTDLISSI